MPAQKNVASAAGNLTVAITGASGMIYAFELLRLAEADRRVAKINLIISDSGLRVLAEELGIRGRDQVAGQLFGGRSRKLMLHHNEDIGANVASGSYPAGAMIVIPCSAGTLARIANGIAGKLIERAADVCLKERRPLVLCLREAPLSKVHIRNLYRAADAGAIIFPASPVFYDHPPSLAAMARQFACRVLAQAGLAQPSAYRWKS